MGRRGNDMNALLMGAQMGPFEDEFAKDTGQMSSVLEFLT